MEYSVIIKLKKDLESKENIPTIVALDLLQEIVKLKHQVERLENEKHSPLSQDEGVMYRNEIYHWEAKFMKARQILKAYKEKFGGIEIFSKAEKKKFEVSRLFKTIVRF